MGKALIFNGISVPNPLRIIEISPTNPKEFVDRYASVATNVTSAQKEALETFVSTLLNDGIWDNVLDVFPMLGGIDQYNISLNRPSAAPSWSMPNGGTTWDSVRNAPRLNLAGLQAGTPLVYAEGEIADRNDMTLVLSKKTATTTTNTCPVLSRYAYADTKDLRLVLQNGGNKDPYWATDKRNVNLNGYANAVNENDIYTLSSSRSGTQVFVNSNGANIEGGTGSAMAADIRYNSFAFGGYAASEGTAPALGTLCGNISLFMVINKALSKEQVFKLQTAIYNLEEALGRHTNF